MEKNSYWGIWIHKDILKIIKNGNERILLAMIISLSKKTTCTASNDYLARELFLSKGQVSKLISNLEKVGIINRFVDKNNGNKRSITINQKYNSLYSNTVIAITKKDESLYSKTTINNIEDNKENIYISPYLFLKKNNSIEIDMWEKENKKLIPDYNKFIEYFDLKVQEDKIDLDVNKLFSRLKRLKFNWNPRETNNKSSNDLPIKHMKRIG